MPEAASLEELLKAGAHFGHLTRRWNPKMQEFIFMQRNGIHIIDLKKTQKHLQDSLDAVSRVARSGKKVLFVGTKKQAQEIVKNEALRCGMPYVTNRWLGGMLTNFSTVRKSIARMEEIDNMQKDGTYESITKKERLMLDREKAKLEKVLAGIANMPRLPGAIFVVDTVKENIAMNEAIKLNIPIFALVDTNCDPDIPDYIIPCNDDASRTIQLITSNFADAIVEGAAEREAYEEEQLAQEAVTEIDSDSATKEKAKDLAKDLKASDDEDEEKKPKRKRRRKTSSKKKSKEDEE
ncbi:MAG TPA: 30S ribosomal protein S2 [Balneolales bacterium]|nr:30S ribosomal protein S2 [Balneolales bacterium]